MMLQNALNPIHNATVEDLLNFDSLLKIILQCGLNSDPHFNHQQSDDFSDYMGYGLHIWQQPVQYANYLLQLANMPQFDCYVEYGVYQGGTFISTIEFLTKIGKRPLESHAVDIAVQGDLLTDYCQKHNDVHYHIFEASQSRQNTAQLMHQLKKTYPSGNILLLIDADHTYKEVSKDYDVLSVYANVIAMHDIDNTAVPGVAQKWQEIKTNDKSFSYILEFNSQTQEKVAEPFFGMGILSKPNRSLEIFALGHQKEQLTPFESHPWISPVDLNAVDCGVFQNNLLAEFRFYMGPRPKILAEYVGVMTARWNDKYQHKLNKIETLNNLNLSPGTIWCSHLEHHNWKQWVYQFGGKELMKQLQTQFNMQVESDIWFVWSGNYIMHKNDFYQFFDWMQQAIASVYDQYKWDIPFVHPYPEERHRNFGFLAETLLMLYMHQLKDKHFAEIK